MAIALEAISGALAGFSVKPGPGNLGRAAGAGFEQVSQERQQADQQQNAQAQQDLQNQTVALKQKAAVFESNSRAVLNTAQAERLGIESLKDITAQNATLLQGYTDVGEVQERNVSQDALNAGMKSGKYDPLTQTGVPDGFTTINGHPEQTFAIVRNPNARIPISQAQWDSFAANSVPGFTRGVKIPPGFEIPGSTIHRAEQQVSANKLMTQDVNAVQTALAKSPDKNNQELARSIPSMTSLLADPKTGPSLRYALGKFQKYVSHSNMHGMDFYQSLQMMASPSMQDPRNPKQFIPNPSSHLADTIAGALGNGDPAKGWQILHAYHEATTPLPIKNASQAESIAADPTSSPRAIADANRFLALDKQRVVSEKAATKKAASGSNGGAGDAPQPGTPGYEAMLQSAYEGNIPTEQLLRYGKPWQTRFLEDEVALHPDFNAGRFRANAKLLDSFTSGKGAVFIQSMNALNDHVQDALDNISELGNTNVQALNTPLNKLKEMGGNSNVAPQVIRLFAVQKQLLNVLENGHAAHDNDLREMARGLNINQTPATWKKTLDQIQTTAQIQASTQNEMFRAVFHRDANGYRPSAAELKQRAMRASQAQAPPTGATMKVPGSDGKMHWSDGKRDLGVVQ